MAQQDAGGDWFDTQGPPSGSAPAPGAGGGGGSWFDQPGQGGGAPVSTTMPVPNPAGGGGAPAGAVNLQSGIQSLQGLVGPDATREQMEAAINQVFGQMPGFEQAYKESVKINGKWYDLVQGYGAAGAKWNSNPQGTTPEGEGGGGADGGGFGRLGGGMGSLAGIAAEALETSPGYQFRLNEGLKGIERGAAAKGTLLTGGTLKGLTRYAQDFASNEYANNYARLFGEQNARYNQLYGLSSLGLGAAGTAGQIGSSYAGQAGNLYANQAGAGTDLITSGANAGAAGTVGAANAWGQFANQAAQTPYQLYLLQQSQQQPVTTPPYNPNTRNP